jgi:nucleoside-diphosphate-sugar epimerase
MDRVLVTGAFGQIGTELSRALRHVHGQDDVAATGPYLPTVQGPSVAAGPCAILDVTDSGAVEQTFREHRVDVVYHLAARLSAVSEDDPQLAWAVNMGGLHHMLEAARLSGVRQVFWPSSIAAFGPATPNVDTPQDALMRPTTIYGVVKVAGELLCGYYVKRYGLDIRGGRYPGVISSEAPPGGGTTDYAVAMFYAAVNDEPYTCFVRADTVLPMIYMPDCVKAAMNLMQVERSGLRRHNSFNIAAMSFSAQELADEITRHVPGFVCRYVPDARQDIADSWPRSLDDTCARQEWGGHPDFTLADMTEHMLSRLRVRQAAGELSS